jgi:single-strand DNA-binding protein
MSGSLNLVVLVGRVGRDPESRFSRTGDQVVNLSLATTERWNKDGQKHERTEWHRVEVWGGSAKFVSDYVAKGALVLVEGSIRTDEWKDKDGKDRKTTKINAKKVELLSGSKVQAEKPEESGVLDVSDDDVPF